MSQTIRRRKNFSELLLPGDTVKDALWILKATLNTLQSQEEDECNLHGILIAEKLRKLSEDELENFLSISITK